MMKIDISRYMYAYPDNKTDNIICFIYVCIYMMWPVLTCSQHDWEQQDKALELFSEE